MKFEFLTNDNINSYIKYLKKALEEDPDQMCLDSINEKEIISRVNNTFYQNTKSILAIIDGKVLEE